jgi:predicted naringenin-chalcone synthase
MTVKPKGAEAESDVRVLEPAQQPVGQMYVAGIGTAVPPHAIAQQDAAAMATTLCNYDDAQKRRIEKLYGLTRVSHRHSVLLKPSPNGRAVQQFFQPSNGTPSQGPPLSERMECYEKEAPRLALEAAQAALLESGVDAGTITHIITVSCSGFVAPGIDVALIRALELPSTTERTHVGFMGCHGALNAIRVAHAFLGSMPDARILIVAVELCSLHYQYSADDEVNLANGLFSDGAAALILTGTPPRGVPAWRCAATGSCILPDSEAAMTWKIRDHGFQMTLSREVPAIIKAHLLSWLSQWLSENGLSVDEVKSWAIHPGGPAILQGVRQALSLKNEDLVGSWDVLRDYGNMSSPTVLFVIDRLRRQKAPLPCVALGFGPGLAAEAVLWV